MKDLRLAFRNLFRHRIRSAIALSAIVFGVSALILSSGFIDWIFVNLREATIRSRLGHIQVTRPDYFRSGTADPFAFLLPDSSPEMTRIAATPHLRVLAPRIAFGGLISHGETTVSFLGEGVDPEKEIAVSQMLAIKAGTNLSSSDPNGITLGEGLAANMGVTVGDTVVLLASTATGGMNAVETHVRGLFSTYIKQYDDAGLRLPLPLAQQLLRVDGSHTWVLLLDETEQTDSLLRQLRARFPAGETRLAFRPWYEMADFYTKTVKLFSRQMGVVNLIIGFIIVLSISNTLTKSVIERTGEIGTLMATGTNRAAIRKLFLLEGMMLGLIGGALGLIVGVALARAISFVGIPMPPPPGSNRGYTAEVLVTAGGAGRAYLVALGTALVASLHPAWKASRLKIVDALRHNR